MNNMYIRYVLQVLADLAMNLLGYLLNPILPLFAQADGNLPNWLKWFGQHDSTLDGNEPRFISSTMAYRSEDNSPKNSLCKYILRVLWLYRNNAYGFSFYVLGAKGKFTLVSEEGVVPSDRYPAKEGSYKQVVLGSDGKEYFQYKFVKSRGNGKCYEANVGWKINNELGKDKAQLVIRWTPFRKFETTPI